MLVPVPREPVWRALSLARAAYLRSLGNSPGNRQPFSRRAFVQLCETVGETTAIETPVPWTMVLLQPGAPLDC